MVGQARALIARFGIFALLAAAPAPTAAEDLEVRAACRDGMPHGAYELRAQDGALRVAGAFNRGKRTGSFIYWSGHGARLAHVPYDDDHQSGTLSLWYPPSRAGREPQPKVQAGFAAGTRNGVTRSWYADGRPRALFRYETDSLADARAWTEAGTPLPEAEARKLALRDREADDKYYASLDAIVSGHLPDCRDRP